MPHDDVVILSAARSPIGKFQGALSEMPAPELGAAAIRAALARAGLDPARVAEVIMGNVVSAGLGQAPARQAAIAAGLPEQVGALTVNKVCGSGLKAVMLAASSIAAGDGDFYVAGGMENMNRAPYLLTKARFGYRLGNAELVDAVVHDGLWCAFEQQHMGLAAEWIAEAFGVTREAQDEFACLSQQRAAAASAAGRFRTEIATVSVPQRKGPPLSFEADEALRPDTTVDALRRLKPAFKEGGSVTAGNAPGITDGAAALVVARRSAARAAGLQPIARVLGYAQAAVRPLEIFTAPVFALRRLADRLGVAATDFDLYELNEAFAAQAVANIRELALDLEKVNVNGGAIALGHPIGASGARVLTTLLYALRDRGLARGAAALCLGGGEAVALAVEIEA
ncbi:MAG: Acetyl-CoA acetyltransferase [Chloroflexi bacterium ADurb.Bin325]|nr:MAG: Acetyl-CoA acetyltransferase [Chloroflexi bacterium ADurb.Bin325]